MIPTETITRDKAVELLNRAVAERGEDYVYKPLNEEAVPQCQYFLPQCQYFHGDTPGCIVGLVVSYLGVTGDDLRSMDANARSVVGLAELIPMDEDAECLLFEVQGAQDTGTSWGAAVSGGISDNQVV